MALSPAQSEVLNGAQVERAGLLLQQMGQVFASDAALGVYAGALKNFNAEQVDKALALSGRKKIVTILALAGSAATQAMKSGLAKSIAQEGLLKGKSARALTGAAKIVGGKGESLTARKNALLLQKAGEFLDRPDVRPYVLMAENEADSLLLDLLKQNNLLDQQEAVFFQDGAKEELKDSNRPATALGGKLASDAVRNKVIADAMQKYGSDFAEAGLLRKGAQELGQLLPEDLQMPGSVRSFAANRFGKRKGAEVAAKKGIGSTAKTAAIAGAISSVAKGEIKPLEIANSAANWAILAIAFGAVAFTYVGIFVAVPYLHIHMYLGKKQKKIGLFQFQPFTLGQKITVFAIDLLAFFALLIGLVMFFMSLCVVSLLCFSQ